MSLPNIAPRIWAPVKSCAGELGRREVCIGEVLLFEIGTAKIVQRKADTAQVMGLVIGGGIELTRCDATDIWFVPKS